MDELNMDAACAHVVRRPVDFDLVLATKLFGDIFSDAATALHATTAAWAEAPEGAVAAAKVST